MQPDGNYVRSLNKDLPGLRFQGRFYEILPRTGLQPPQALPSIDQLHTLT